MQGRAITEDERIVLMHVVAVVLSMANLAERAAYLPLPIRWLSLWALWRARSTVEGFLSGTGSEVLSRRRRSTLLRRGYSSADALDLAATLLLLAFALRRHTLRLARPWLTWKGEAAAADPVRDRLPVSARNPQVGQGLERSKLATCDTS
jgi:hypothetical protein